MTDRAAILAELLADPVRARLVPRADAVELLLELARVTKALELLAVNGAPATSGAPEVGEAPLTVDQVMQLTGLSRRAVWARSKRPDWRPYVMREGRKTLHFRPTFRSFYAEWRACK